jgi:glutathione-regulated potassium-efflux system ancillary protein KefF
VIVGAAQGASLYAKGTLATMPNDSTLVLLAHPDLAHSRVTRRMAAALAAEPGVSVRDLYARYPDYWIDVPAERAALQAAQLVIWLHPIHWYSMPALMKLWVDQVLGYGWAYGPGGTALAGKDLWLCTSAGGSAQSYSGEGHHSQPFEAFLPAYRQTAALTRMRFLPPAVFFHAHRAENAELDAHVQQVLDQLRGYPAGFEATPWPLPDPTDGDRPDEQELV